MTCSCHILKHSYHEMVAPPTQIPPRRFEDFLHKQSQSHVDHKGRCQEDRIKQEAWEYYVTDSKKHLERSDLYLIFETVLSHLVLVNGSNLAEFFQVVECDTCAGKRKRSLGFSDTHRV